MLEDNAIPHNLPDYIRIKPDWILDEPKKDAQVTDADFKRIVDEQEERKKDIVDIEK
jgi:hypothetical protein